MTTRVGWRRGESEEALVSREWLVTNGLGGYASGTIAGAATRRYHGLLVAALPNPLGRCMMFNHLSEQVRLPDGRLLRLGAAEQAGALQFDAARYLTEFRLDLGLPVWTFGFDGYLLEKRLYMSHLQNTVYVRYRLLEGPSPLRLSLLPAVHFRPHDAPVSQDLGGPYTLTLQGERFELSDQDGPFPPLRVRVFGREARFVFQHDRQDSVNYRVEADRGYEAQGNLWSHGYFKMQVSADEPATLVASTEAWETITALGPERAHRYEGDRRVRLLRLAQLPAGDRTAAELVLAADQFLIAPAGRIDDATRARAQGEELRTVIAGYHWFTDWGRDTMISLEGLALSTGRAQEARFILNSFSHYVREGLIPNMFPEGAQDGLYHTADATLWFFHAIDRYLAYTGDRGTLRHLLPRLEEIVAAHRQGTRFGIRVDPQDGLLTQGHEGLPLSWMDAKCDGWVVTPRRGKPVEINALWYNALRLMERWLTEERGAEAAAEYRAAADRLHGSFNTRFWFAEGRHLYDVLDGPDGAADPAFRPNQLLAVSLPNPVLTRDRWPLVVDAVRERLLTPVGLRSLAREHPDYKPTYHGDLRTRDAAYHQGTAWSFLIGPFIDAWLKVHGDRRAEARQLLTGLEAHLGEACIGSISEVFDAEAPFTPRGCIAQAWGVAEMLRVWLAVSDRPTPGNPVTTQ
jgi:predicted glycogen debranching enzyme